MAKNAETVEIPAADWRDMLARMAALERAAAVAQEKVPSLHDKLVLDAAWEKKQADASRTAAERTQDIADREYGTKGPRWTVRLDSTSEDGKPGPNVSEHPTLTISANSPEEAEGRWLKLCGIRKHDYRLVTTPTQPEPVAA